jgi:hypothetical protein
MAVGRFPSSTFSITVARNETFLLSRFVLFVCRYWQILRSSPMPPRLHLPATGFQHQTLTRPAAVEVVLGSRIKCNLSNARFRSSGRDFSCLHNDVLLPNAWEQEFLNCKGRYDGVYPIQKVLSIDHASGSILRREKPYSSVLHQMALSAQAQNRFIVSLVVFDIKSNFSAPNSPCLCVYAPFQKLRFS